ncbi:uncharacterized protein EDB91DRAFT_1144403 [Suillus paluster]|uniref:uncharacterized protein n=1 Tax=Suillus paluster TaxID=48578 RepID=UPI001B85EB63|nr:uncharacterized protein EDB91DRAFT_1144403 [Suillus paluster]KAG1735626.1 hypothetical protein EDB91DRAFT_1144403 [Suillus paluster]
MRGRLRALDREDIDCLLHLVRQNPDYFLDELMHLLATNQFISVHFTTIFRKLERGVRIFVGWDCSGSLSSSSESESGSSSSESSFIRISSSSDPLESRSLSCSSRLLFINGMMIMNYRGCECTMSKISLSLTFPN